MTPLERDRDELTDQADAVVVARCVGVESRWNADRTMVITDAAYQIDRPVKGTLRAGDRATVEMVGGTVGTITHMVVGGPRPRFDDRALLFLRRDGGRWRLASLVQGLWPIRERGGDTVVIVPPGVRPEPDDPVVSSATGRTRAPSGRPTELLDVIVQQLQRHAGSERAK
jgi:hypothetical protein